MGFFVSTPGCILYRYERDVPIDLHCKVGYWQLWLWEMRRIVEWDTRWLSRPAHEKQRAKLGAMARGVLDAGGRE